VAGETATAIAFEAAVSHSLDRKVCNTLNVCCIARARADQLVPVVLDAIAAAGAAGTRRCGSPSCEAPRAGGHRRGSSAWSRFAGPPAM
jgi:hypothetical protein